MPLVLPPVFGEPFALAMFYPLTSLFKSTLDSKIIKHPGFGIFLAEFYLEMSR